MCTVVCCSQGCLHLILFEIAAVFEIHTEFFHLTPRKRHETERALIKLPAYSSTCPAYPASCITLKQNRGLFTIINGRASNLHL